MRCDVKVLIHLDACGEFAINFLQNYTVKIFDTVFVVVFFTFLQNYTGKSIEN